MKRIIRVIAVGILPLSVLMPSAYGDIQSDADAAWEGLSSEQQTELTNTGEIGYHLDELVISFRNVVASAPAGHEVHLELTEDKWNIYSEQTCLEDMPCWDCKTMGNRICGPAQVIELPRTL